LATGDAHPEYKNINEETALTIAVNKGYSDIVKLLQ